MKKIRYIQTKNSIVFSYKGKKITINRIKDVVAGVPIESDESIKIRELLAKAKDDPTILDEDESPLLPLIDIDYALAATPFYIDKIHCKVYVDGVEVNEYLGKKIIQAKEGNKEYNHIINFWKKVEKNPLESARKELFLFLEHNGLPLTEDGYFVAYKSVRSDYYSAYNYAPNNPDNVLNKPGQWVLFDRSKVDTDRNRTCSNGLHAANYYYAHNVYGGGDVNKLITLIIDPSDVVAVPSDYNNQKMRVCAYFVLEDCSKEYTENFIKLPISLPAKEGKLVSISEVIPEIEEKKAPIIEEVSKEEDKEIDTKVEELKEETIIEEPEADAVVNDIKPIIEPNKLTFKSTVAKFIGDKVSKILHKQPRDPITGKFLKGN